MTAPLRILTVRQPWAWAIMHGGKNVENRVRNIAGAYRGPIAIHVAQSEDEAAYSAPVLREALEARFRDWSPGIVVKRLRSEPAPKYLGRIIGVVDLVDVHESPALVGCHYDGGAAHASMQARLCSPWAEKGARHLVLENPRPLAGPIRYRGALGLRPLDTETTARILAQIGEPQ